MEKILEIDVEITGANKVEGNNKTIVMIEFKGDAKGPLFTGKVVGTGVDTQKISKDGVCLLSARYMLEGIDSEGKDARIFIENNSDGNGNTIPTIVTDSNVMAPYEDKQLISEITGTEKGVLVEIFCK